MGKPRSAIVMVHLRSRTRAIVKCLHCKSSARTVLHQKTSMGRFHVERKWKRCQGANQPAGQRMQPQHCSDNLRTSSMVTRVRNQACLVEVQRGLLSASAVQMIPLYQPAKNTFPNSSQS